MSGQSVEIVRRGLAAFAARDVEAWVECADRDVELLLPRNVLEGGSYKGHEGVRQAFADAFDTWEAFQFDPQEIRTVEDWVVWLGHTTIDGKGESPTVTFQSAYLAEMRAGKIVYFRPYQSHQEALEAAGLSE